MKTKAKAKWVLEMRVGGSWSRWGSYSSKEEALRAGQQVSARTGEGYQVRKEAAR